MGGAPAQRPGRRRPAAHCNRCPLRPPILFKSQKSRDVGVCITCCQRELDGEAAVSAGKLRIGYKAVHQPELFRCSLQPAATSLRKELHLPVRATEATRRCALEMKACCLQEWPLRRCLRQRYGGCHSTACAATRASGCILRILRRSFYCHLDPAVSPQAGRQAQHNFQSEDGRQACVSRKMWEFLGAFGNSVSARKLDVSLKSASTAP